MSERQAPAPDVEHDAPATDARVVKSRTRILEAARAVVLDEGIAGLTVERVIEGSGVARATIYRHWPSRDLLLRATIQSFFPEAVLPDPTLPFEERLRSFLGSMAEQLLSPEWRRFLPEIISASRHVHVDSFEPSTLTSHQRRALVGILTDAIASGDLRADTNLDEAVLLLLGPLTLATIDPTATFNDGFTDRIVDGFLAGHRP